MFAASSGVGVPLSTSTVRSARGGVAGPLLLVLEPPPLLDVSPSSLPAGTTRFGAGGGFLSSPPSSLLAPNAAPATTTRPSSTNRMIERTELSRRGGGPLGIRRAGAGVGAGRRSG